jgi:ribA/ribD-fused uncharacterized protein
LDKTRHKEVKYVEGEMKARMEVNNPRFIALTELGDNLYECESAKSKITLDLPIVLGYFVLQYAKLRMLEFHYDFIDKYIDRKDYELVETDTDSLYLALAGNTLQSVIKPEYIAEFKRKTLDSCNDLQFTANEENWFPRECCTKHSAFDKRTPGLFKHEAAGSEMICLSSKTYVLRESDDSCKLSCKGMNKARVHNPLEIFMNVMETKETVSNKNIGFRARKNGIWTYTQERAGFGYFYCKREVLADGIRTVPLKLQLTPWTNHNTHCFHEESPLGLLHPCRLQKHNAIFGSASQLFNFEKAVGNDAVGLRKAIAAAKKPIDAAKLGSKIKSKSKWYDCRDEVMEDVLNLKLEQVPEVLTYLENYKGMEFVCIDEFNNHWGCGHKLKVAELIDPKTFAGQNKLGELWKGIAEQYFRG